jgi:hypothetical protein
MTENKLRKRKRKLPCDSISYTTGDIDLNIARFNQAFGTAEGSEVGIGGSGALCEAETLEDMDSLVENWWKELF